jgi:ADP-heptose:LPS heptosyltransferase
VSSAGAAVRLPFEVRSIAVIRALQLGDLLVAVPALRSLRAGFPDALITLIGLPWAAGFARRFGKYIDRFVEFSGYPGISEVPVHTDAVEHFLCAQRACEYDLVVQLHGDGTVSNQLALDLGGRATLGYTRGQAAVELTISAPYPDVQPEIVRNLALVNLLGCPDCSTQLEFPLESDDLREAERLLGGESNAAQRWIGLHPGASVPARRWPAAHFAALADALAERWDARIVLTGGATERDVVASVAAHMRAPALTLAGYTSLGGLAAVIARLALFVSNDTGPAHLAAAVQTPSVVLFGPGDVARWGPLDRVRQRVMRWPTPCSPCGHAICPIDQRCLTRIAPAAVYEVANELLKREAPACVD